MHKFIKPSFFNSLNKIRKLSTDSLSSDFYRATVFTNEFRGILAKLPRGMAYVVLISYFDTLKGSFSVNMHLIDTYTNEVKKPYLPHTVLDFIYFNDLISRYSIRRQLEVCVEPISEDLLINTTIKIRSKNTYNIRFIPS